MNSTLSPEMGKQNGGRAKGNVTLKQIALDLGVSHQLVSYALNDTGTVGEETRKRIKEAAERMGYRRNGIATSMKSGRFGAVTLLLSTDPGRSHLPQQLWDGIHDELAAHDMTLSMARLPDEKLTDEGVVPKMLREWMVDGLLIDYTDHIPQRMIEIIRSQRLPAIWINSQQKGDCIYSDDLDAGKRITRHLLEKGHRRICFLDFTLHEGGAEHYSARERREGFQFVMRKAGLEAEVMGRENWERGDGDLVALLQQPVSQRPTAFLTYGSETALLFMAAARLGLSVPQDFSVATFGSSAPNFGTSGPTCFGQQLTAMLLPQFEVGRRATQMLLQKIEKPNQILPPQVLPFGFETGGSVKTLEI